MVVEGEERYFLPSWPLQNGLGQFTQEGLLSISPTIFSELLEMVGEWQRDVAHRGRQERKIAHSSSDPHPYDPGPAPHPGPLVRVDVNHYPLSLAAP